MASNLFIPNGKFIYYYDEEKTKKRTEGEYSEGILQGILYSYYENGNVAMQTEYLGGVPHGSCIHYREDGTMTAMYVYEYGQLQTSSEFCPADENTIVAEYTYMDSSLFVEHDGPEAAPAGNIIYLSIDKHPAEIYPGTIWKLLNSNIRNTINGTDELVNLWSRVTAETEGPYIYNGDFKEYRDSGSLLRTGTFTREIVNGVIGSTLDKKETYYRTDSPLTMFTAEWKSGIKHGKTTFYDEAGRIWKEDIIENGKRITGKYNIYDIILGTGIIDYKFNSSEMATLIEHK